MKQAFVFTSTGWIQIDRKIYEVGIRNMGEYKEGQKLLPGQWVSVYDTRYNSRDGKYTVEKCKE